MADEDAAPTKGQPADVHGVEVTGVSADHPDARSHLLVMSAALTDLPAEVETQPSALHHILRPRPEECCSTDEPTGESGGRRAEVQSPGLLRCSNTCSLWGS